MPKEVIWPLDCEGIVPDAGSSMQMELQSFKLLWAPRVRWPIVVARIDVRPGFVQREGWIEVVNGLPRKSSSCGD